MQLPLIIALLSRSKCCFLWKKQSIALRRHKYRKIKLPTLFLLLLLRHLNKVLLVCLSIVAQRKVLQYHHTWDVVYLCRLRLQPRWVLCQRHMTKTELLDNTMTHNKENVIGTSATRFSQRQSVSQYTAVVQTKTSDLYHFWWTLMEFILTGHIYVSVHHCFMEKMPSITEWRERKGMPLKWDCIVEDVRYHAKVFMDAEFSYNMIAYFFSCLFVQMKWQTCYKIIYTSGIVNLLDL